MLNAIVVAAIEEPVVTVNEQINSAGTETKAKAVKLVLGEMADIGTIVPLINTSVSDTSLDTVEKIATKLSDSGVVTKADAVGVLNAIVVAAIEEPGTNLLATASNSTQVNMSQLTQFSNNFVGKVMEAKILPSQINRIQQENPQQDAIVIAGDSHDSFIAGIVSDVKEIGNNTGVTSVTVHRGNYSADAGVSVKVISAEKKGNVSIEISSKKLDSVNNMARKEMKSLKLEMVEGQNNALVSLFNSFNGVINSVKEKTALPDKDSAEKQKGSDAMVFYSSLIGVKAPGSIPNREGKVKVNANSFKVGEAFLAQASTAVKIFIISEDDSINWHEVCKETGMDTSKVTIVDKAKAIEAQGQFAKPGLQTVKIIIQKEGSNLEAMHIIVPTSKAPEALNFEEKEKESGLQVTSTVVPVNELASGEYVDLDSLIAEGLVSIINGKKGNLTSTQKAIFGQILISLNLSENDLDVMNQELQPTGFIKTSSMKQERLSFYVAASFA